MCCLVAKEKSQFVGQTPLDPICGQAYDPSKPAAPNLFVRYPFCRDNCNGIGLSKGSLPGQWAAPLVQFILPSVIFAMTIPRRKHIDFDFINEVRTPDVKRRWLWWILRSAIFVVVRAWAAILLLVDTTVWVAVIIVGAAYMMVAGLYEALLDHRVLRWLEQMDGQQQIRSPESTRLLVTVVSGNLRIDKKACGRPQDEIPNSLMSQRCAAANKQEQLLSMMGAQYGFGSIVGAPVVFYLGAFVYTILDLGNDPSNQDAAISLAFGVEWMIIPHVAIVAGCLLASNNPSTASVLTSHPRTAPRGPLDWFSRATGWRDVYDTLYQPVNMWSRGTNKMDWIKSTSAWTTTSRYQRHFKIKPWEWIVKILLPTFVLISLPATAGAVVAYETPPKGWGCRSLSFIIYAASQVLLAVFAVVKSALLQDILLEDYLDTWTHHVAFLAAPFLLLFSLLAALGGTLMQIVGVLRNCICYVNAQHWMHIRRDGQINVASDTQDQRGSSGNWIVMGSFATAFMGFCCYLGWWYTRYIRHRFQKQVRRL